MTMIYDPIPFVKLIQKFWLETTSLLWLGLFAGIYLLICTICNVVHVVN